MNIMVVKMSSRLENGLLIIDGRTADDKEEVVDVINMKQVIKIRVKPFFNKYLVAVEFAAETVEYILDEKEYKRLKSWL